MNEKIYCNPRNCLCVQVFAVTKISTFFTIILPILHLITRKILWNSSHPHKILVITNASLPIFKAN